MFTDDKVKLARAIKRGWFRGMELHALCKILGIEFDEEFPTEAKIRQALLDHCALDDTDE